MLMIGGRSLSNVPIPLRLFARRRGGSFLSRCGVLFSPRILVQLVSLEFVSVHRSTWSAICYTLLKPMAKRQCMSIAQLQFARELSRWFATRHPTQQHH